MKLGSCAVEQISLWPEEPPETPLNQRRVKLFDLDLYEMVLLSYSGGKDSLACLLWLIEMGVPREKIQLHHQCVDGQPGSPLFADWPVTEQYVLSTGKSLGIPVHFQWRVGGFKGELFRENALTGDVQYMYEGKIYTLPTTKGKHSTRRKFPAKSPNLSVRWCSASLKIDTFSRFLANHPDFKGSPFEPLMLLVITGERREESPARSRYLEAEEHRCSTRGRIVHNFRPVIDYPEDKIWNLVEKYQIVPHPAYLLGFSRTTCLTCIFCTNDLWAMVRELYPERFNQLVEMERELGFTIDNKYTLTEMANGGSLKRLPRELLNSPFIQKALQGEFHPEDFYTEKWILPAGAFRGSVGGPL